MDSCCVCDTGIYTFNDTPSDYANADMSIDEMVVSDEGSNYRVDVYVKNHGDDDAYNTILAFTMPVNSNFIEAVPTYQKCGALIKFCLGHMKYQEAEPRHITIRTTKALMAITQLKETFGAFVHSTSPDPCPANNFRCWLNNSVSIGCNIADTVIIQRKR